MDEGYPGLKNYWPALNLSSNSRVLVPLCGKSVDMIFLEQQGADVVGVEVSQKAVLSFFSEQRREFHTKDYSGFTIHTSGNIELWQGDFLKYPAQKSGFDLIYDKAALVALPPTKQTSYVDKLHSLAGPDTKILLHHFVYPQHEMQGPPFSVKPQKIDDYFSDQFTLSLLEEKRIPSEQFIPFRRRGLKSSITERLLILKPRK